MNLKSAVEVIQSETEKKGHLKSEQIISDAWDGFMWPRMCSWSPCQEVQGEYLKVK